MRWSWWITMALCVAWVGTARAQEKEGRRVALVIGISTYERLPAELGLETARTEAARVAAALEQGAGFDQVRLLTDASASTTKVREVLEEQVSKEVQWRDLFLLYFVGHGMGSDFGDSRLLFYDTDPEAIESTSMSVKDLASMLQKFVPASRYVVVTDAAHTGELNGLALLGPTGNDWPQLGNRSFVVSSAAPRQTTQPGVFSKAFVEAISGQADTNADGAVSGGELNNFLVVAVPNATGGRQLPTVQSSYDPTLEVARQKSAASLAGLGEGTTSAKEAVRVDKAKFVFQGGGSPKVQCTTQTAPQSCDPSCYVWDVLSGPCTVMMSVGGKELAGTVNLLYRGAYTCGVFQDTVQCSSPPPPQ